MPARVVEVIAPSRLHFGMFSFGQPHVRQFGGVGGMINAPEVRLRFTRRNDFYVTGPLSDRAAEFAQRAADAWRLPETLNCHIEIIAAPPPHVGLGSGTQLAMSVAAGLRALLKMPELGPVELAQTVGRGRRSAIGLYGFAQGGLLVESGKHAPHEISPLTARLELPETWRFLLLCPKQGHGLSGTAEHQAFEQLPPVPLTVTDALCRLTLLELLPACAGADFSRFSQALYDFGQIAGSCFAAAQTGGAWSTPQAAKLAATLRSLGVQGIGQSSWGPTLFALVQNEPAALDLQQTLARSQEAAELQTLIAAPSNRGAQIICV